MHIEVGPWVLEVDVEATAAVYDGHGSAEFHTCDCSPCRNFKELEFGWCPTELKSISESLGIDISKPAEVYHMGRVAGGDHLYGAWYHAIGQVRRQPKEEGLAYTLSASPEVQYRLTMRNDLAHPGFPPGELIQFEIVVTLPWVSTDEEPEG